MPKLSAALLESGATFPEGLSVGAPCRGPERVIQFGEGNFLRGFVDWMIHCMNQKGLFDGRAVLVQPIARGLADVINAQDGLYTLLLRGIQDGQVKNERSIIRSVSRCVDPYSNPKAYEALAEIPEARFVVSNTTEAGITFDPEDKLTDAPAASFPGKLTQLLYRRFVKFGGDPKKGLIMLPCELIERNGDHLRSAVRATAENWKLEPAFVRWLDSACVFANTLVDRIVTGYPRDEAPRITAELGYEDALLDTAEVFHLWVIEAPAWVRSELPLTEAGLNVVWTDNMTPYRERKVRILNGAHTAMALAAFLDGKDTVRESLEDPLFRSYVEGAIEHEILPTLDLPADELKQFASQVIERFGNPFIEHQLLSISLNSVSKYKARIYGTVLDYHRKKGVPPERLAFALAALIAFYRGIEIHDGALIGNRAGVEYRIIDDPKVLSFFASTWWDVKSETSHAVASVVTRVVDRIDFWGTEVPPGFAPRVAAHLQGILTHGVRTALTRCLANAG